MIASQLQQRNDEHVLSAPTVSNRKVNPDSTPIISNCKIPKDVNLDDGFVLDSPASVITELSSNSIGNRRRQRRTPRFSSLDDEPIVVARFRSNQRSWELNIKKSEGLSRPKNHNSGKQQRKERRYLRSLASFSILSSIRSLMINMSRNITDERDIHEGRFLVGKMASLLNTRDTLSCWTRDFSIEIFRRLHGSIGAFGLLPSIFHTTFHIGSPLTIDIPLSASEELQIQWKRQNRRRNLSFRRRRERPICVSGLPNQGQTCFLNAVLQSLASLNPFLEYLEGIVECQEERHHLYLSSNLSRQADNTGAGEYGRRFFAPHDVNENASRKIASSSFSKELLDLLKGINRADGEIVDEDDEGEQATTLTRGRWRPGPRRRRLDPKALLRKIAKNNPQFSSYGMSEQQDAQELFASMMGVVIHDSQLDTSSSDRRLETTFSVGLGKKGKRCIQSGHLTNQQSFEDGHELGISRRFESEVDRDDGPITLAMAHCNPGRMELEHVVMNQYMDDDAELLGGNQTSDESKENDRGTFDVGEKTKIFSLSRLLLQIGKEQNKSEDNPNRCCGLTTSKGTCKSRQDYQNIFAEEKKQDCFDAPSTKTRFTQVSTSYRNEMDNHGEEKLYKGLLSPCLSGPRDFWSSAQRLMRSTMSSITPSPLSGWLGSTIRCSKCKHVRPIQNAPFLDIPLVPTSVPAYLSSTYKKSTSKPASPDSNPLPSCSLETCLENFTSIESVHDVECRKCTMLAEIDRLEEEAMMLRGAIETTERRIYTKAKAIDSYHTNSQSLEETRCLREDLSKVETRLSELKAEDPDQDDDDDAPFQIDESENDNEFFFGAVNPRDKVPLQRCDAQKCLLLTRTPSVLCCHIQRRYYDPFTGRMKKCVQFVEFPQFLDLSPYCAYGSRAVTPWVAGSGVASSSDLPQQQPSWGNAFRSRTAEWNNESMLYQLQSVIEHRGNAFGGHYVCYRRDHTGSWFCISDNDVTRVSWRAVQTCQAYMLFYETM